MRDIKFRAWDNKINKYIDNIHAYDFWFLLYTEDIVIEQYTGLQDKNGKDIYEGDIVRYNWENVTHIPIPEDGFGPAAVVSFSTKNYETDSNKYDRASFITEDCTLTPNCKIIGNIHENPELII